MIQVVGWTYKLILCFLAGTNCVLGKVEKAMFQSVA
jgi:hypothetical protein